MKKYLVLFFGSVLLLFSAKAQEQASSLLWEISGNGLNGPSYVFGTFHLMCRDDFSLSPILLEKIKSSKAFYGELKMDDADLQAKMMGQMQLNGSQLSDYVSAADLVAMNSSFQQITGFPLSMFHAFKPFLSMSLLAINSLPCENRVQPEQEFLTAALQLKLAVFGLETVEDEMTAINKEPIDSQVLALKKVLLNFDSVKLVMQQLTKVYLKRNTDSIYAFMKETDTDMSFENALLSERNKKWLPVMVQAMKENPVFFAVGAGHLGGEEGVLALLRSGGYQLKPVAF